MHWCVCLTSLQEDSSSVFASLQLFTSSPLLLHLTGKQHPLQNLHRWRKAQMSVRLTTSLLMRWAAFEMNPSHDPTTRFTLPVSDNSTSNRWMGSETPEAPAKLQRSLHISLLFWSPIYCTVQRRVRASSPTPGQDCVGISACWANPGNCTMAGRKGQAEQ